MLGFFIKWIGVIVLAFLVYHLLGKLNLGLLTFNVFGSTLSLAAIGGWLTFFLGAGVNVKS